jgi:GT2 family glycosyltransferase
MDSIVVSVIIASSRKDILWSCLNALAKQNVAAERFEVILVTDADGGNVTLPEGLKGEVLPVTEINPCTKRNQGAVLARGEIMAFIDDDVIVPQSWLGTIFELISPDSQEIWGGPNVDQRQDLSSSLVRALEGNPLLEGLKSHRYNKIWCEVGIHDVPLCNLITTRKLFQEVGGFSEDIPYYFDDVDFNYRAIKKGAVLYFTESLTVHHSMRSLFRPYFIYKFKRRYAIGRNFSRFGYLYDDAVQLKAVHFSYAAIALSLILLMLWPSFIKILMCFIATYIIVALISFRRYVNRPFRFVILPVLLLLTHCVCYCGYTCGRIAELIALAKRKKEHQDAVQ